MKTVRLGKRKINDIVDEDYVSASVLFYFGIAFYKYSDKTLQQVCNEKGLSVEAVVQKLESVRNYDSAFAIDFEDYPVDLIVEYLKHAHYIFIKEKLPYIANLIESFPELKEDEGFSRDLKFVFPLFVEDFIHHVYEEEDTLFDYVIKLLQVHQGSIKSSAVFRQMEDNSLQKFAIEHEHHDDEMKGIRKIANNYKITGQTPLHVRVIFKELKALEKELILHARIENDILFPKALALEKVVRQEISNKIGLN